MDIDKLVRGEIRALEKYKAGKLPQSKVNKVLKMSSNENLYGCSPLVIPALNEDILKGLHVYPDSSMKNLKEAVVGYWERRGIAIKSENLIFGDGSSELLGMLLSAFVREGDSVIIPERSFTLYHLLSASKGANVVTVGRKGFVSDFGAMAQEAKRVKNPKLIILANPDNPTSTLIAINELERILQEIPSDVAVLIDEAYIHFAGIENSALGLLSRFPNLIVLFTLSKAYGLAALRVGYAVMHEAIATEIEKIRLPFNLGRLQQKGASVALSDDAYLDYSVSEILWGRDYLESELSKLGIDFIKASGNFIMANFGERCAEVRTYLEEWGISIRPLTDFGYSADYVRITVAKREDNVYFIEKLNEFYHRD